MGSRLGEREILLGALPVYAAPNRVGTRTRPVMTILRIILGDQLSLDLSALDDLDPGRDVVLMMEVMEENTHVQHHKQKIVLVLAAMRHFAEALRQRGLTVDYVSLDASDNTGSFTAEIQRAVARHRPSRIVLTEPSEWRVQAMVECWEALTGRPSKSAPIIASLRAVRVSLPGLRGATAGEWNIFIARCGANIASLWKAIDLPAANGTMTGKTARGLLQVLLHLRGDGFCPTPRRAR